jgi:protease-4
MSTQHAGLIRRFLAFIVRSFLNFFKTIFKFLFGILAFWVISIVIISALNSPEPLPDSAALVIVPKGAIVEQLTFKPPFQQLLEEDDQKEILLNDLIESIDNAATDSRINSIVLYLHEMQNESLTTLRTIGEALERFKAVKKPVVAIADSYSQAQYYLASYADTIYINPFGGVEVLGIGTIRPYFKEALDKLNINMHVFKVGTFKDAVEPFTRNSMSKASRQHNTEWISQLWQVYTEQIERRRELPKGALDDYVQNIDTNLVKVDGDAAQLALGAKLVDHIVTRPERTAALVELAGSNNEGTFSQVHVQHYLQHIRGNKTALDALNQEKSATKIGVIVAKGEILDGNQHNGTIGGDSLGRLIRMASQDDAIKALVLRVDSPGGSAYASEIIRQEIMAVKAKGIPVVVSMGSVAASGGYWISANADEIWASPTTITGSIGVFGMMPTFEDSFTSLGIRFDEIGSTDMATAASPVLPMSPKAAKMIQTSVDGIYKKFLTLVAEGRNSTPKAIDEVAQGRVWTGRRAQELGLVDQLGGLDQAIASAATMAGIDNYKIEYLEKPLTFEELLFKELSRGGIKIATWSGINELLPSSAIMTTINSAVEPLNRALKALNDPNGIYLSCFECSVKSQ